MQCYCLLFAVYIFSIFSSFLCTASHSFTQLHPAASSCIIYTPCESSSRWLSWPASRPLSPIQMPIMPLTVPTTSSTPSTPQCDNGAHLCITMACLSSSPRCLPERSSTMAPTHQTQSPARNGSPLNRNMPCSLPGCQFRRWDLILLDGGEMEVKGCYRWMQKTTTIDHD